MKALINGYYQSKTVRTPHDEDTEEADKVSANIARILNEQSFAYSVTGFTSIHRRLNELKNRYMVVNPPQNGQKSRARQAPDKHRSTNRNSGISRTATIH